MKVLMEKENERLRKRLFNKDKKPSKKTSGHARHMTSEEMLDALARDEWASKMAEVFKETAFKQRKKAYEKWCRDMVAQEKAQEKEAGRAQKEAEKEEERRRKDAEKMYEQEHKLRERERVKALKDSAKLQKAAAVAAAKAEKARLAAMRQGAAKAAKGRAAKGGVIEAEDTSEDVEEAHFDDRPAGQSADQLAGPPIPVLERPRPRAIRRPATAIIAPSSTDVATSAASVAPPHSEVAIPIVPVVPVLVRSRVGPKQLPAPGSVVEPVVRRSARRR